MLSTESLTQIASAKKSKQATLALLSACSQVLEATSSFCRSSKIKLPDLVAEKDKETLLKLWQEAQKHDN